MSSKVNDSTPLPQIYTTSGKIEEKKSLFGLRKQTRVKLDTVANEALSQGIEAKKNIAFFQKHQWVPILVKDQEGNTKRMYVNVDKLAKSLDISHHNIRQLAKAGMLESLIIAGKEDISRLESERTKQRQSLDRVNENTLKLLGIDPKIPKRIQRDMPLIIAYIEKNEEHWDQTYNSQPKDQKRPLVISKKVKGNLPYSMEYLGKNSKGEPQVYLRYHGAFARGSYKTSGKVLNPILGLVLVKSKQNILSHDRLNNAEAEAEIMRDLHNIDGLIQLRHEVRYQSSKGLRHAIFTDYHNMGELGELDPHIPEKDLREGMIQILTTVNKMHQRGYAHRDIKPANILVHKFIDSEGKTQYKFSVADLGLTAENKTNTINRSGTPMYLSPQQIKRIPSDRQKDDSWQLGCTFETIFKVRQTGISPFNFKPKKNPKTVTSTQDVIDKLLQKDPKLRYTPEQALKALHRLT